MENSWVIIWVSTWCKAEGVQSGVYFDKSTAIIDKDKLNLNDTTRRFHVVDFNGKEHKHALMQHRESAF